MIRKHNFQPKSTILLFSVLFLIVACAPQTPIPIYITPTQAPTIEGQSAETISPTIENVVMPTINPQNVPTIEFLPSTTPAGSESLVATSTVAPVGTLGSSDMIGAIIGEGYTIPPTSTARPSRTPIPEPTTTTVPTLEVTTVTTPLPDTLALDRTRMGVQLYYNMDVAGWDATLGMASQMRVDWIKLQAAWEFLQPNGQGQFDQSFRLFQLHVQEADKRGFKVMISIAKAPDWARNIDRNEDGPADDHNQLVSFINFMLEKVGPHIDAIEIWNEPNLKREWTGGQPISGGAYMDMFRPAYNAIRAYSRDIVIVTAGLAPTGTTANVSVDDRTYLQQMYSAGLAQYQDVVIGIHPYSWGNSPDMVCCDPVPDRGWDDRPQFFFTNNIQDYHNIMTRNGHNVKMWTTEFGWATWEGYPSEMPDPWMSYNTPTDQMNHTLRAFELAQKMDYMGPMILWNMNFANETIIGQRSELAGYSLLYPGFDSGKSIQERPLYWAIARRP